jgi:DENN domain-containing protein 5
MNSLSKTAFFLFLNGFLATSYSVLIVPSKKFNASSTSANPYMKLYGSLGESDVYGVPKNTLEFVISVIKKMKTFFFLELF